MKDSVGIKKTTEKISMHFDGEKCIEIETLLASLEYTKTTLKAIKNNISGITDYQVIIEPFKEGSFIVDITLLVYAVSELLPTAVSMGKVFLDTIKIWKALQGKPAQQVIINQVNNTIRIEGNNNNVIIVSQESLNTATDSKKIADDIATLAKKMLKDTTMAGSIEYFIEKDNDIESIKLEKVDVKEMKVPVYLSDSVSGKTINIDNIVLKPIIVNFNKIDDWKFSSSYSDKPFKAKIEDAEFRRKVVDGEIYFGHDTKLRVILQTIETTSTDGLDKRTQEYSIIKVEEIINREKVEQVQVEFNDA